MLESPVAELLFRRPRIFLTTLLCSLYSRIARVDGKDVRRPVGNTRRMLQMTAGKRVLSENVFALARLVVALAILSVRTSEAGADAMADAALMKRLRIEIEAIPELEREAKGVQILIDNLAGFQTEETRRRVNLAIGDLLEKQGDTERARFYHAQAAVPSEGSSPSGAAARDRILESLQKSKQYEELLAQSLKFRDAPSVTDYEYATLTHRAGLALANLRRTSEAVELALKAARERPSNEMYHTLETLSSLAKIQKDMASTLKGMHWLNNGSGDFGRSERFLGNLAHYEERSGNIDEAIRIRKQILDNYPQSQEFPFQLSEIIRLSFEKGDRETARVYCVKVLEGDYARNYREYARRMRDHIDGVTGPHGPAVGPTPRNIRFIVAINSLVVIAITVIFWARWRYGKSSGPP